MFPSRERKNKSRSTSAPLNPFGVRSPLSSFILERRKIPKSENVGNAAFVAFSTEKSIDLGAWALQVAPPMVVYPFAITAKYVSVGAIMYSQSNHLTCQSRKWSTLSGERAHAFDFEPLQKYTFAVVVLYADIMGTPSAGNQNIHVVLVFLHRESTQAHWRLSFCDPNRSWPPSSIDEQKIKNLERFGESLLWDAGMEAKKGGGDFMDFVEDMGHRIEHHRCFNSNICIDKVGTGICFSSPCLSLSSAQTLLKVKGTKASNGNDLLEYVFLAAAKIRNKASQYLAAFYGNLGEERLERIFTSSTKERTRSPYLR